MSRFGRDHAPSKYTYTVRLPNCPQRRLPLANVNHQVTACEPEHSTHSRRTSWSWAAAMDAVDISTQDLHHHLTS